MNYEFFLARAFNYNKTIRRACKSEYINLAKSEKWNSPSTQLKFEQQREEVKSRLIKALNIFIEKSTIDEEIADLKRLQFRVSQIRSYTDVSEIITIGLEITKNVN
jgi:hypothetical protein